MNRSIRSENDRISPRQIRCLLILESLPRMWLLLPYLLAGKSLADQAAAVVLGSLLWYAAVGLILRRAGTGEPFFDGLARSGGRGLAAIVYAAGFWYFLSQAAVLLSLWGALISEYAAPELPMAVLCALPLAAGLLWSRSGVGVRGRICETAGPAAASLVILLIFLAGFDAEPWQYGRGTAGNGGAIFGGAFEVFACMGGMFLPLLAEGLDLEPGREKKTVLGLGSVGVGAAMAGGCLGGVTSAFCEKNAMEQTPFAPVLAAGGIQLPGGASPLWELLFLALLLAGLAAGAGGALWYMGQIITRLVRESAGLWGKLLRGREPQPEKAAAALRGMAAVLSCLAAAGFSGAGTAMAYYRAYNLQILFPLLAVLILTSSARIGEAKSTKQRVRYYLTSAFSRGAARQRRKKGL